MTTGSHHNHHHSSHHHHNGGTSHLDGPGAHSDISNQLAQLNEGWLELESDPGLFSSLITDFGCRGVKVEEIYDLERPFTDPEERPTIYGFIFLFNVIEERRNRLRSALPGGVETVSPSSLLSGEYMAEGEELLKEMFFAYQKVPNSCATHAILSVLMNCQEQIDLGALLLRLKEYTKDMSPENKGYAISNMPELAQAHNSHAAPSSSQKEQQLKQSSSSSGAIRISSRHTSSAEAFHFVSFVPINGRLIELDGLKELPIDHGPIESSDGHDDWTEKFRRLIRARIETPHGVEHDIRYNLMAVIPSRFEEAYEKMARMLRQRYMLLKIMEALEFTGQIGVFRDHAYTHTEVMETSFRSNPFVVGQSVGHFGSRRIEVDFVEGKLVKDEKLNGKESNQLSANSIKTEPEHQPPPLPSTMEPPAAPQLNGNCTRTRNTSRQYDEKNIHGRGFKITYDVYQNPLPDEDDDDEEGEKKVKDEDVKSELSDSESTDSFVSSDSQLEPKSRAWFERVRAREEKEEAIPPGILSPPYKTVYMETSEDAFQDNERFWTLKFEYKPDPPGYVNPYDSVPPPRASSPLPPEVKVEPKVEIENEEQIKNVQNESQIVEAKVLNPETNPETEANPDTEVKSEADEIEDVSIEIVTPPSTLSGESPPPSSQSSDLGKRRQEEEDSNEVKRQKTCSDSSQPEVVVVATDSEGSQPEPEVVDYHNSKQEEIECIDLSDEDAANSSIEVIEIKPEDDDDDGFETEVIEVKPGDIEEEDEEPEDEKEPETVVMPETVDFVEGSTLSGGDVEVVVPPITATISGTTEQNPPPEMENSMEVDVKQVEPEIATAKTDPQLEVDSRKTNPQTEVDAKSDPQTEVVAKSDPQPEIDSKTNPQSEVDATKTDPQTEVDAKSDPQSEVVVSKSNPEQEVDDFAHMQTPPSQSDSVTVTSSMNGDGEEQEDEEPSTASLPDLPYFEDGDDKDDDDVNKLRSEEVRLMSRLLRYAREQKNQPWTGSQFERRLKPVILSDLSNLFFYLNNEIMKWNKILNEERRILQKQLTDDTRRVHDYDAFINLFITLFFEQGLMDKVIGKELCVNSASGSGTSAATAAASSTSTGNSSTSNNHHENHHTTTHAHNGRSGTSASTISSNSNGGGNGGFKVLDPSRVATVQSEYKALGHRLGVDNGYFLFPCNFNISDHAAAEKLWFAPGDVPLPGRDDNADREPEEVDS